MKKDEIVVSNDLDSKKSEVTTAKIFESNYNQNEAGCSESQDDAKIESPHLKSAQNSGAQTSEEYFAEEDDDEDGNF